MVEAKAFSDPDLEEAFLAAIVQKHETVSSSSVAKFVKAEHFETPTYRWLADIIIARHGDPPSKGMLSQIIDDTFNVQDEREKYKLSLHRLYTMDITGSAEDSVITYKKFIAIQQVNLSVKRFYDDFSRTKNVDLALREFSTGLGDARQALTAKPLEIIDFAATFKAREERRKHKRDNPDLYPRLRLGISKFDAQVKMEFGTVTNFLAPMKRYKSVILTTGAYAGLIQGFNVALVILENSLQLTTDRLDAMFAQISYDRVVNFLKDPSERKKVDELYSKMDKWPQRLKIIKGEPGQLSIPDIDRELKRLEKEEGFQAEVKIVDYLNLLKPSVQTLKDNDDQTTIVWDMQNSAKDPSRPSIYVTASQANMAGAEIDKDGKPVKVKQHHQGRSIGISQAVDNSIGIDIEYTGSKSNEGGNPPPQIILSPLFLRDGSIMYPEVRCVSEIDRMCIDREQRKLWDEVEWT